MSMLRRLLLLLSVTLLLQEGLSNSPLDFLRDLKNKIFTPGNSSEVTDEPAALCSSLDQDGVCALPNAATNGTLNESLEKIENPDINNTQSLELDDTLNSQPIGNETAVEDSYNLNNTQYFDEQEGNRTNTNNTDNGRNDFEYPENIQNGTDVNGESPIAEGEERNQTENARYKRQINEVQINITLKKLGVTSKPLTLNTTANTENSSSDIISQSSNATEVKERISNCNQNSSNTNELGTSKDSNSTDEEKTEVKTGTPVNEVIENVYTANESTIVAAKNFSDPVISSSNESSDFKSSQNTTEETNENNFTSTNCKNCLAEDDITDLQTISTILIRDLNKTAPASNGQGQLQGQIDENTPEISNTSVTGHTNITKLQDILENSTRIIEKIVQNIVPVIGLPLIDNDTITDTINDTEIVTTLTPNTEVLQEETNLSEEIKSNNTETESEGNIFNEQLNSTALANTTSKNNQNSDIGYYNGTLNQNTTNSTEIPNLEPHANEINNMTDNFEIKREKRNINFTILSENYEESDDSESNLPETTENTNTGLPTSTITDSIELDTRNGTEEIEIVGPVCIKRYEQCTNSTECCEDYECISKDGINSTSYCDLRLVNLTSTSLPAAEDITDQLQ